MKSKKILLLVTAIGLLALVGIGTAGAISAEESNSYPSIVQKLVERFNLNAGEVEEVFDEFRGERHQEMQVRFEERLDEAVNGGDLTEEQKQAMLAKLQEFQQEREANREAFQNMTREERQEASQAKRAELEAWAEENGIEMENLFLGPMGPKGGHQGWGGFKFGNE